MLSPGVHTHCWEHQGLEFVPWPPLWRTLGAEPALAPRGPSCATQKLLQVEAPQEKVTSHPQVEISTWPCLCVQHFITSVLPSLRTPAGRLPSSSLASSA